MATRNWSSEEYVTDTKQVGDAAIVTNTLLQAKLNLWHVTIKAKRSYITVITVTWQWSRETLTEWRFTTLLPSLTWTGDAESGWTLRIRLNCDVAMTKQNQKVHRSWSKLWAKTCTPRNPTRATRMMDMTASIGNTFLEIKKKNRCDKGYFRCVGVTQSVWAGHMQLLKCEQ